jgi:cell cycle sensor histidine kinase DivJ
VEARRLSAALAGSPDVFLTVDHADRIVAGWGGGDGKLMADAAACVGRIAGGLFAEPEVLRFHRALDRVRKFGDPERLVLAGDEGLIEVRLTPTDAGEVTMALRPASPEVEALPKAMRERDAADAASRARSRFFASMSHELRTPLNAVLGFSDVMRSAMFGPLPARYAEYADDIHSSAKHLLDLVGDLLDVSRIEAGRYELEFSRFDAREAAEGAARMMRPAAEAGQVRFELAIGEAPIEVEADLRALKQMLLNLTSNAVKFSGAKGVVTLSLGVEHDMLVAAVTDTGPGLTSDEIGRLARPFEQTKEGRLQSSRSSGLGLALVKSLCELHGGKLEIESEPGQGSTFRMRLPVLAKDGEPSEEMDARGRLQRVRDARFADDAAGEA